MVNKCGRCSSQLVILLTSDDLDRIDTAVKLGRGRNRSDVARIATIMLLNDIDARKVRIYPTMRPFPLSEEEAGGLVSPSFSSPEKARIRHVIAEWERPSPTALIRYAIHRYLSAVERYYPHMDDATDGSEEVVV